MAAFRTMQQARHIGKIVIQQPEGKSLPSIRPDGTYLITGGLRGLGLLTAEWLAEQGARHLALMGRSQPTQQAMETLKALEDAGVEVLIEQGDVSLETDVLRLLDRIQHTLPPLRGIIHSAGLLDDAVLVNQTWQHFETVMAPKVTGAQLLHRLTEKLALDFFVLYSSVASLFGSAGQANHAAANAFLDALAHFRHSQGLAALSINWGVWREVGAAADRGAVERSVEQGIDSFSPQEGLEVLGQLMHSSVNQIGVSPINWPLFLNGYKDHIPPFLTDIAAEELRASMKSSEAQAATHRPEILAHSQFLSQLAETPSDRKRNVLTSFVQAQAARVLGLLAHEVKVQTPLNEMGLDSLMAIELRNLLGTALALSRPLPVTLVYDYPTVVAISDYLASEVIHLESQPLAASSILPTGAHDDGILDSIEDLSDEDVERRLAEMNKSPSEK